MFNKRVMSHFNIKRSVEVSEIDIAHKETRPLLPTRGSLIGEAVGWGVVLLEYGLRHVYSVINLGLVQNLSDKEFGETGIEILSRIERLFN